MCSVHDARRGCLNCRGRQTRRKWRKGSLLKVVGRKRSRKSNCKLTVNGCWLRYCSNQISIVYIDVLSNYFCFTQKWQVLPIIAHPCSCNTFHVLHWSYSTVRKYRKPYLRTLGRDPRDTFPYIQISLDWAL